MTTALYFSSPDYGIDYFHSLIGNLSISQLNRIIFIMFEDSL